MEKWDSMSRWHVPLVLDQKTHGPIWGRLNTETGYGEFLYQPSPPRGTYRDFRFLLVGKGEDAYICDKYHDRIVGTLESDVMTSTMEELGNIPVCSILDACRSALTNARS